MGTLSVGDRNTLDQIARMAWGSSEGANGGRGNIGIIKDEYGRSRIIKTDTHLFGSKTANGDKADLVAASNELRTTLIKIAENSNLESEKLNEIRGLLGMPEDNATADTPLKRRAVAQVVAKIDSTVWERATTGVNMKDFSSSRCDTDYKSVSRTNASEGKASRVIQKPWDSAWRRLSTVSPNALAKAVDIKFGELLDKHFGDRIRNFVRDHQKTSIVDGKPVGREKEYAALKETIDDFDNKAVANYHCYSGRKDQIQKKFKRQDLFRSLVDELSEEEAAKLKGGVEKDRKDIANNYVRKHSEDFGLKQNESNGKKTEDAIKETVGDFDKFLRRCVEYAKKENGEIQEINKEVLSRAALKRVVKSIHDELMDSIASAVEYGVVKHTGNREDGTHDEYTVYRTAYAAEHKAAENSMESLPNSFGVALQKPSDAAGMLDPSKRDEVIGKFGLKSALSMYFCQETSDSFTCKVSTEGVIRETKWVMDNLFELVNPGADDQDHLDFVNQTVNALLEMANAANS